METIELIQAKLDILNNKHSGRTYALLIFATHFTIQCVVTIDGIQYAPIYPYSVKKLDNILGYLRSLE